MQRLSLIILSLFLTVFVKGVNYSTFQTASGGWTTVSNWNGAYPGCCNLNLGASDSVHIYGRINIGTIAVNQNFTMSRGVLSIKDTLIIYGNLTIGNNGDLYISNGAVLIVYGDVSIANQVTIAANSYFIIMGDFTKTGAENQGSFTSDDQPSNVFIGGTVTIPGEWSSTDSSDVFNCASDSVYENSGCNYGNPIDLIDDPISDFVNDNCTDIPNITAISSNSPVLVNNSISLSANGDPGTGTWPLTYNWQGPSDYNASGANITRASATTGMTGYYILTLLNTEGCTAKDSTYVEIITDNCCLGSSYVSRDNYTGNWEDETSWATPNELWRPLPPPTNPMNTQTLCINGTITVNGDLTINGGSQKICDTLIITGNLNVQSYSLAISPTGVLIVLGNYTGNNGSTQNEGRVVVVGEIDNSTNNSITGSGDFYIFDDDPVLGGFTPTGDETVLENNDPGLYDFVIGLMCSSGLSGGTIAANQNICAGDDVAPLTNTENAGPGSVTYQWYSSTDSSSPLTGTWNIIPGATGNEYDPGTMSTSTWFYRRATGSGGCNASSNTIAITVFRVPETGDAFHIPNLIAF